jgi:phosphoglycolate phosphatase
MIEAVIFDVDGVLLDSRAANIVFYRNFLVSQGYPAPSDEALSRGHTLTMRETLAFLTGEPPERVEELLELCGSLEGYPAELTCVPDGCSAALDSLSADYRLGVVTSRLRFGIDHFFEFSGLGPMFDVAIGYEDYARPKPAPDPLLTACDRLGVAPEKAVYVGDAPTDYACSRAAGTYFIAYGDAVPEAPHVVSSFGSIKAEIERLAS